MTGFTAKRIAVFECLPDHRCRPVQRVHGLRPGRGGPILEAEGVGYLAMTHHLIRRHIHHSMLAAAFAGAVTLLPAAVLATPAQYQREEPRRNVDARQRLEGTYRLSATDSDNPDAIADRVLRGVSGTDRARVSRQLRNRLTPPEIISIDRNDRHVSIASSIGPQMEFDADGRARSETGPGGRTVTTRASVRAGVLEVSTSGSGGSDFAVTFEALDNGRSLRVTRRLYNDALRQPVVVRSLYRRTSETADWNVYSDRGGRARAAVDDRNRGMTVPTGTTFVATLDDSLNLRDVRDGDYISMRVEDGPSEFRNATIEGYVTTEPTRASSRSGLGLGFERIKLADGRVADFSGTIDAIRDPSGRNIAFDRAEANRDNTNDRSDQAIQRGAIGATVGAILGAVVGGAKGAGIGAAIGAGGGAGTVLLDNQSQTLPRGTRFTIRSDTFDMR